MPPSVAPPRPRCSPTVPDPPTQNLAIAAAAVGMAGREGGIFRKVVGWSLGLLLLMRVIVVLQSTFVLDWMVPWRSQVPENRLR